MVENFYLTETHSLLQLLRISFSHYGKTLKAILPFILLGTVVQDAYIYVGGMPNIQLFRVIVITVMAVLAVYIWSAALLRAHQVLSGEPRSIREVFRSIYAKASSIYAGFFALILGFCLIFFIGHALTTIIVAFASNKSLVRGLSYLFLIGFPVTFLLVIFFFAIPLLIVEQVDVWPAFRESARLVGYKHWLKVFSGYASVIITLFIVMPGTRHAMWLRTHYVSFFFDILVLIVVAPLIINFVLVLLSDLRLRKKG